MCRGAAMYRSTSRVSSPKLRVASRLAEAIASSSSAASVTRRMPLPPPPADGLSSTGRPTASAAAWSSGSVRPAPSLPGTTRTPCAATSCFARILSPIASTASGGGPTKVTPAATQARASAGFSDRNP